MQIDELLEEARGDSERLTPAQAHAMDDGVLVDIRGDSPRERDGGIPGAVVIERNVLEWRCAPDSQRRDERVSDPARRVVLICNEGYQSSLAPATLRRLGLPLATDVEGGFQAWRAAGLPVERT